MLAIFSFGVVLGVLLIVFLLKMTMREEPAGCLIAFGLVLLFLFWSLVAMPWVIFAG